MQILLTHALSYAGPGAISALTQTDALGRLGNPEEIGELLAFLVSGKSSFVTGQVIDFTGGWPNR